MEFIVVFLLGALTCKVVGYIRENGVTWPWGDDDDDYWPPRDTHAHH